MLKPELEILGVGRDKLFTILRANQLLIKARRSYRTTTNSHHRFRKHKNLIEHMEICRPNEVWVSDITYLGSGGKHKYLSLITDAYSKRIMGYNLSESLATAGALSALKMALKSTPYKASTLIHHSDRGLQYCSDEYQKILNKNGVQASMTEKYDPYQNAIAERINGIIKNEFELEKHMNSPHFNSIVKETIELYNSIRPHFSNNYLTPNQMHQQSDLKPKSYKVKQDLKASL